MIRDKANAVNKYRKVRKASKQRENKRVGGANFAAARLAAFRESGNWKDWHRIRHLAHCQPRRK